MKTKLIFLHSRIADFISDNAAPLGACFLLAATIVACLVLMSSCASFPTMATVAGPQDRARTHRYIYVIDSTGYHKSRISDVLFKDNCLDSVMVELDNRYVKR